VTIDVGEEPCVIAKIGWSCGHGGYSIIQPIALNPALISEAVAALVEGAKQVPCWICRVKARGQSNSALPDSAFLQSGFGLA
jgi:hypothetical protein